MSEVTPLSPPQPCVAEALHATVHVLTAVSIGETSDEDDRYYGTFPARVEMDEADVINVYFHNGTMNLFRREYCDTPESEHAIEAMYIDAGIVSSLLRDMVHPQDTEHVDTVYCALSSSDTLLRSVFEANFTDARQTDMLLLAIRESWITTDFSDVNAIRLALRLAEQNKGANQEKFAVFTDTMQQHLLDILSEERTQRYLAVHRALGGSLEEGMMHLYNTIPPMVLAGSYPMPHDEANRLFDTIARPQ